MGVYCSDRRNWTRNWTRQGYDEHNISGQRTDIYIYIYITSRDSCIFSQSRLLISLQVASGAICGLFRTFGSGTFGSSIRDTLECYTLINNALAGHLDQA